MKGALFLAAIFEGSVFPIILLSGTYAEQWELLVGLHVLLSMIVALTGKASLPALNQMSPWIVRSFFMTFSLCIPMVGASGVIVMVLMARAHHPKVSHGIQEFTEQPGIHADGNHLSETNKGDHQVRLRVQRLPSAHRLDALGKLQTLGGRQINVMIRDALADQVDEIRLVAFGILDKQEQTIHARIAQEQQLYREATDPSMIFQHARLLAYAYWELVYKEVVEGEIQTHALSQAQQFALVALEINEGDAGMWALLGQIHLRLKDFQQARTEFTRALDYGIPDTRVTPYLAEVAFYQQDFSTIPRLFGDKAMLSDVPALRSIGRYWSS